MNELHFTHKIRQHLNRGVHDLQPATANRLAAMRERALAHQKVAVHQSALAGAVGHFFHSHTDFFRLKHVFIALALLAGMASYTYWQADSHIAELSEVDSALLADDLPMGVFTDKGFDAWLKNSPEQ